MKKKLLTLVMVFAVIATLAIGGTLAYFTDTDSAKNVMVVGNVKIEQNEQERTYDEEGNAVGLGDFQDDKKLLPITNNYHGYPEGNPDENEPQSNLNEFDVLVGGDDDGYPVYDNEKNFVDKIVTVKNTGTEEAYVRTLFAFEGYYENGSFVDVVGEDENGSVWFVCEDGLNGSGIEWLWQKDEEGNESLVYIDVNGTPYIVGVYYYENESKIDSDEITNASLTQVYAKSFVDNTFYEKIGEEYEILVLSQATQTAGFENAYNAFPQVFPGIYFEDGKHMCDNVGTLTGWFEEVE